MAVITRWFMLFSFVLIAGYDVFVATNAAKGDTISELTLSWAWRFSTLPLAWGVVVGHLCWPAREVRHKWPKIWALWAIGIVCGVIDIIDPFDVMPAIPMALGVVIGRVLWPQQWDGERAWFTIRADRR
jgi:hypothetical protein